MSGNVHYGAWQNDTGRTPEPSDEAADVAPGGSGPHPPDMEQRVSALEADNRLILAALERIEPKIDKMDDRARATEARLAEISGQLGLLTAKIPSWWQPYLGTAGLLAVIVAALGIGKAVGVLH